MPDNEDQTRGDGKLRRRLVVLRLAVIGGAGAATSACTPATLNAGAQVLGSMAQGSGGSQPIGATGRTGISDADPSDAPGRGRGGQRGSGVTDADPSDQPGFGRSGVRRAGISDSDPSDPAGGGRGGVRPTQVRTGLNDADPSDSPGFGRGRSGPVRTGLNDSDPSDSPGFGRRGR